MKRADKAAERQILKAQAEGKLDNLKGQGSPLDMSTPHSIDAVGYAKMAEEGVLPEELRLKAELEDLMQSMPDSSDPSYKPKMSEIADLQMRYEIAREARKKFTSN